MPTRVVHLLQHPQARLASCLGLPLVIACCMGASCTPRAGMPFGLSGPAAPVVLGPAATVDQIVAAVNQNSARVQTYQASRASFSMPSLPGIPLLSGSIAAERPHHFRLRAETRLSGPEIDLGSNAERFWVWARRNEPPGIYTARHSEAATNPALTPLPIEPSWLLEALGMVTLDPAAHFQGPFPRPEGSLELRTQSTTPGGGVTRVYVVDAQTASVLEQHIYDGSGSLVASVESDRFRFDPVSQASLPERATLRVPAADLSLVVQTGPILINAPIADGGQLWQLPQLAGYPVIDLAHPPANMAPGATQAWDLGGSAASAPWTQQERLHANFSHAPSQGSVGQLPAGGIAMPPSR